MLRKNLIANTVTGIRILLSILLFFCPLFSPAFYILYLAAGFSDMIDGTIARKLKTESEFGARLDTAADLIFAGIVLIKIVPELDIPLPIWIWIAGIAGIKIFNLVYGFRKQRAFNSIHTAANRITGILLYIFPLTLSIINLTLSSAVLCALATFAAVQETGILITAKNHSVNHADSR